MKGATLLIIYKKETNKISIHAPVKGATSVDVAHSIIDGISIHAPVKGATAYSLATITFLRNFNPRTREGCDVSAVSQ